MIIFPAIDLRRGKCVRLRQGDPAAETVFGHNPVEMALHWEKLGASWLHIVNLDGALGDETSDVEIPVNVRAVKAIREAVDLPVQFGGGIRTLADVEFLLDAGVSRVILGTVAVKDPELLKQAVLDFGASRVVVGLDTREGMVATHGWQEQSQLTALEVGRRMRELGVELAIHTDIGRDAMMTGVSWEESAALAKHTDMQVIASGGVSGINDIERLLEFRSKGIVGVITGQALYTGALELPAALELVASQTGPGG